MLSRKILSGSRRERLLGLRVSLRSEDRRREGDQILCILGCIFCDKLHGRHNCLTFVLGRPGKFSTVDGASSNRTCQDCVAGKYSSAHAADNDFDCLDCAPGTFAGAGASTCAKCAVGKYASETSVAACVHCPAGKFSNLAGASACANCPDFSLTTHVGSLSKSSCVCIRGYEGPDGGPCVKKTSCEEDEVMSYEEVASSLQHNTAPHSSDGIHLMC